MSNSLYANADGGQVNTGGNVIKLELGADEMTQLTANATPCRVVILSALGGDDATPVHVAVNSAATISLGALVNSVNPLTLHIDDASKLWFSSAGVASVFATYMH